MPALIRYPFFACVILALSACGGSGSSRLLEPETPAMGDNQPAPVAQEAYSSVKYLITDTSAGREKFHRLVYKDTAGKKYLLTSENVSNKNLTGVALPSGVETRPDFEDLFAVYKDTDGKEYLLTPKNVADMDLADVDFPAGVTVAPDFASLTKVGEGAAALNPDPRPLDTIRKSIVNSSTRYLSTGAVLARTDENDAITPERPGATCADGEVTGYANCVFTSDTLREGTTFHLGPGSSTDENRVSFRDFKADREPVMSYRNTLLSQVRTSSPGGLLDVYQDTAGEKYLLTSENVSNKDLTGVALPSGIETRPDFEDLFAVYKDTDGKEYLLTPKNVADMDLMGVTLPDGVTEDTKPDFGDLIKVTERDDDGYEYVGYDGMLRHSMFFIGVYRFFDDESALEHTRFENASLGSIYDDAADESGIQNPSVKLTGEGVMVGMERLKSSLESHLVQGDVNIDYRPFNDNETPSNMDDDVQAMVDISIDNIQRLANDEDAWYADPARQERLGWTNLEVTDSKFSHAPNDNNPLTVDQGKLSGSFYGTEAAPEVGGVFHHEGIRYEIIGSFGSRLAEPDDDEDMMDPMQ